MRRAAVSGISQVAEGWLRRTKKDKLHYLDISLGSLLELETQSEIAFDIKYISDLDYEELDKQRAKVAYLLFRYTNRIQES